MSGTDFFETSVEVWRRRVIAELGGEPIAALDRRTPDGYALRPLYTAEDLGDWPSWRPRVGSPGLCSIVEAASPERASRQLAEELASGARGIWLRLDRASRLGFDPTQTREGELAGLGGTALHHGSDFVEAFGSVSLENESGLDLWIDVGANVLPWATLWLAHCERSGVAPGDLRVHFGGDPLAALAADGELPRDLMKLSSEMAALARFAKRDLPGSSVAVISTTPYHDAGAGLVQELGLMVATLLEYLRGFADSGLSGEAASSVISLRFAIGSGVFPEIAKLRAARYLWRAALAACGVEDPPEPRLHAVGSRRTLSRREPGLNLLRATEQAFAAYCGGADAISLWGFDQAGGARGDLGRRLARNTPLILALEGRLDRVEDPAAGSYYVESMTRDLARRGWALAQSLERAGGMRRALLTGRIAEMLARTRAARAAAYATGEAGITGVTDFVLAGAAEPRPDSPGAEDLSAAARHRLEAHRASWAPGEAAETTYSRDFVVEELLARSRRGATLEELGRHLGGAAGAERLEPLEAIRDEALFEAGDPSAVGSVEQ